MREIQIIGGGLAGLSLGIGLLRRRVPVRLIERGDYPQHKVCGEFISGVQERTLEVLGIQVALEGAQMLEQMSWWIAGKKVTDEVLPTPARGLSRFVLDRRLAQMFVELGGDLETRKSWRGEITEGVVVASGKRKRGAKKWIGLKLHYSNIDVKGLEMHSAGGGYAGLANIESNKVNVCALFELNKEIKGEQLLEKYMRANGLGYLAERLELADRDDVSASAIAGFDFGAQCNTDGFAVGDAQYMIPPFTGNGMSMALESSAIALPFLQGYSEGKSSWDEASVDYNKAKKDYFQKRCGLAAGLHPLFFNSLSQLLLGQLGKRSLFPTSFLFEQLRTP
ncbi:NAD(P)/FAD-dependent oxidoreductase [Rubritalea spongiae]|uniref:NAD(P)/FAD-dependent oxidoreductase n=1 Tax=Rubritalea spongiae TaxID=430797 RepID=A0ABW5E2D7_9BACT